MKIVWHIYDVFNQLTAENIKTKEEIYYRFAQNYGLYSYFLHTLIMHQ